MGNAKLKICISKEEDVQAVQEDLEDLYLWHRENNMKFIGAKFQLLRYGLPEDIKENTQDIKENTEDMEYVIMQCSSLRDLVVIMTDNGKFEDHIGLI